MVEVEQPEGAEQAEGKRLPRTVEEWVADPRGPIPPGRGAHVDRGLMTPAELLRDLWFRARHRQWPEEAEAESAAADESEGR